MSLTVTLTVTGLTQWLFVKLTLLKLNSLTLIFERTHSLCWVTYDIFETYLIHFVADLFHDAECGGGGMYWCSH